jgi:hypothetical protein
MATLSQNRISMKEVLRQKKPVGDYLTAERDDVGDMVRYLRFRFFIVFRVFRNFLVRLENHRKSLSES